MYTFLPFASLPQPQVMIDFVRSVRPRARAAEYPGPTDLHELLALPEIRQRTGLWIDPAGELAACALVDDGLNLVFETRPELEDLLDPEILAWGLTCLSRMSDNPASLDASARARDQRKIARLTAMGFTPASQRTLHFVRPLHQPIPAPVIPPGFSIRVSGGAGEADAWVALHRAAFGTENMTRARRLAILSAPEYDPRLDLVAAAPDGRLAATCVCAVSQSENDLTGNLAGSTDPVATHPDFQRRGLARALLLTGLRLLRERGLQLARLGTTSHNLAMQAAARRAGYEVEDETLWFSRPSD